MVRSAFRFIQISLISLLLAAAGNLALMAQTGSIHLEGIVWDPSGNPLPGITITAVEENTGQRLETVSDSDGYYRFMVLEPGIYTVTAKAEGFKDVIHRNLYLSAPGGVADNISFEVSAIDNEIGPMTRPRVLDSDVADVFTARDLEDMPLLDRNPLTLAPYQPGVMINGGNAGLSSVNGSRTDSNSLVLDGLSISDPLTPALGGAIMPVNTDALSAMQIITANADAAYGGASGAQVVMTSRRGTAKWTGNIYDYFNSHHLDSNDYFNNSSNIGQPDSIRNLFGGAVSGPINDKATIFASYEGNRTERQLYRNRLVLTDEARTGLFRWFTPDDAVRDSTTIQSFDISTNDPRHLGIDPTVASVINLTPLANNYFIGDGLNTAGYEFYNDTYYHQDRLDARVDYRASSRHSLFARFGWNHTDSTDVQNNADASYPGMNSGLYKTNDFNVAFGLDSTFSPTLINELRAGYTRASIDYERPDRITTTMLISNLWNDPQNVTFPQSYRYPAFEVADVLSHSRNVHSFKFGASVRRGAINSTNYSGVWPTVTFGNSNGNVPAIGPSLQANISASDRATFDNLYNSLLGRLESINQTFYSSLTEMLPAETPRERNFVNWTFSGFAQDSWKLRPNLTLNFGVRYELYTAPKESNGYQSVLEQASSINATANIADLRLTSGTWTETSKFDFAPRAGVAWDVFGTGSTVLRGSYGMFYSPLSGAITNFIDSNSYGFSQSLTDYPNAYGTDIRLSDGYALTVPAPLDAQPAGNRNRSIAVLDRNLKTPRVHQLQATLERQWAGVLWEIGYTRTRGLKLYQNLNLNQTKVGPELLTAFTELQAYRNNGAPVSAGNALVNIFGSPLGAFDAMGGYYFDTNQLGAAINTMDRDYYGNYAAAGVSDYYIRNFPQFNQFIYGANAAESWYDAVRIGARKSGANYSFRAFYTWSRAQDTFSATGASYIAPWDSFNPKAAKGISDLTRTHVFNLAWRYALPFGRDIYEQTDQPFWLNALLASWNIGALMTYESGAPFSVNSGIANRYGDTYSLADLDRTSSVTIGEYYRDSYDGTVYWIDPTTAKQFNLPEVGVQGTSERNGYKGPKYFNLDVAMHKSFAIRESQALQVRVEAFNIFNNTHFAMPNTNLSSSGFGTITSTVGTPRKLQFALRYKF